MATTFEESKRAITSSAATIADPRPGRGAALPGPQRSDGERSETERSEGPGNAGAGGAAVDPEVPDRPKRRFFHAEYKRRILREVDSAAPGQIAAILRREGLYSSHLVSWRRDRERMELQALSAKKRGPKPAHDPKLLAENKQLRRTIHRLERRLHQAEVCLEIQKKASELLGIPLNPPGVDESE